MAQENNLAKVRTNWRCMETSPTFIGLGSTANRLTSAVIRSVPANSVKAQSSCTRLPKMANKW